MNTDVIGLLQKKYRLTGYTSVTDWMRDKRVDLSLQSCTAVLLRGQDKGLVVMLTLASALDCAADELQWIAKQKGDNTLWRLISRTNVTKEESEILDAFRVLDPGQKKIITSMLQELVPK